MTALSLVSKGDLAFLCEPAGGGSASVAVDVSEQRTSITDNTTYCSEANSARTAIAAPWQKGKEAQLNLLARPERSASTVALVEPGAIGTIKSCDGEWCELSFGGHDGWLSQSLVWGAYPGETIRD